MTTLALAYFAGALYAPQESVYHYPAPGSQSVTVTFAGEPVDATLTAVRYFPFGIASVPIGGDTTDIPLDFSTVLIVTTGRDDSNQQRGGVAVFPGGSYEWCDRSPMLTMDGLCVPWVWTYGSSLGTLAITMN